MEKKDPAFVKGNQVTLHGKQAEAFVRYRDTDYHFTALYRMDQQQEYITQYFQAVKAASKTDSQISGTHLFDMIQDYMVTDMTKDQYVKIAMDGMEAGSLTSRRFLHSSRSRRDNREASMYTVLTVRQSIPDHFRSVLPGNRIITIQYPVWKHAAY